MVKLKDTAKLEAENKQFVNDSNKNDETIKELLYMPSSHYWGKDSEWIIYSIGNG